MTCFCNWDATDDENLLDAGFLRRCLTGTYVSDSPSCSVMQTDDSEGRVSLLYTCRTSVHTPVDDPSVVFWTVLNYSLAEQETEKAVAPAIFSVYSRIYTQPSDRVIKRFMRLLQRSLQSCCIQLESRRPVGHVTACQSCTAPRTVDMYTWTDVCRSSKHSGPDATSFCNACLAGYSMSFLPAMEARFTWNCRGGTCCKARDVHWR